MFGYTLIKTKKLHSIEESAARLSVDNLSLNKRLINLLGSFSMAEKRYEKVKSMHKSISDKERRFKEILESLLIEIRDI